jgi:hypothetical protein
MPVLVLEQKPRHVVTIEGVVNEMNQITISLTSFLGLFGLYFTTKSRDTQSETRGTIACGKKRWYLLRHVYFDRWGIAGYFIQPVRIHSNELVGASRCAPQSHS